MNQNIRTDLAVEEKESFPGDGGEISGVSLEEWTSPDTGIRMSKVKILNDQGAKNMRKPIGTYLTMEAGNLAYKDEDFHQEVADALADQLQLIFDEVWKGDEDRKHIHVLAVGLGNRSVTPDSLGPRVVGNLEINRHRERKGEVTLSGIVPGVMAQTGMESAEILRGIIKETHPDALLVVDALAARSLHRLGTTIQLTDTGIHPGSGVGNHRCGLTKQSLGIPVVAVGVPTVVGAAAIVHDTVSALTKTLSNAEKTKSLGKYMEDLNSEEQYHLIQEVLEPEFGSCYVTPPDIDETVQMLSFTISEGIHRMLEHMI